MHVGNEMTSQVCIMPRSARTLFMSRFNSADSAHELLLSKVRQCTCPGVSTLLAGLKAFLKAHI